MLSRAVVLKIASWKFVERLVRQSRLFKKVVKRFIAGDTLDEAMAAAEDLCSRGYFVTLDLLGEAVTSAEEAAKAKDTYIGMFDRIAASRCLKSPVATSNGRTRHPSPFDFGSRELPVETANVSIKLTQCGLGLDNELAEKHYREVAQVAQEYGSFLRIDMEDSSFTQQTIDLVERVHNEIERTGTVLQSYLHRTTEDVEWVIRNKMRVRLVKGAYLEPPQVAIQKMPEIDAALLAQGKRLLDAGNYPAMGTHNEGLLSQLAAYGAEMGIPKDRWEIQMIYGIRRDLQEKYLAEGYNVRIYIPFGDSWYPYFSRRLAERPANMFFIFKALLRR